MSDTPAPQPPLPPSTGGAGPILTFDQYYNYLWQWAESRERDYYYALVHHDEHMRKLVESLGGRLP